MSSEINRCVDMLNDCIKVQVTCSPNDEYMRGMANGMIFSRSVLTGLSPGYIEYTAKRKTTNIRHKRRKNG